MSPSGTTATVRCFNTTGSLTEAAFTIAYTRQAVPSGLAGAYGTANQLARTTWYQLFNGFNTTGGQVQARRAPDPANP